MYFKMPTTGKGNCILGIKRSVVEFVSRVTSLMQMDVTIVCASASCRGPERLGGRERRRGDTAVHMLQRVPW